VELLDRVVDLRGRDHPEHDPEGVTTASYPAKASTKLRTTGTASSK
jgi:hypothetical protein